MKILKLYRQGDVGIALIDKMPEGVKAESIKDRIVLAYGEVTGHAHAIAKDDAKSFLPVEPVRLLDANVERFLQVSMKAVIRHEEHSPIELPKGDYAILQQREYSPEEVRRVAD